MTGQVGRAVMVVLDAARCTACGACLVTCPPRALVAAPRRPDVLPGRCTGCLACIEVCPRDAISEAATRGNGPGREGLS